MGNELGHELYESIYDKNYDYTFKLLLVGESGIGKTFLLYKFTDNINDTNISQTIGISYKSKNIELENLKIKLKIFDAPGLQQLRNFANNLYPGTNGVLLIYDVSNKLSFEAIPNWFKMARENTQKDCCVFLVGSKCDIENRVISEEEGKNFLIN